MRTKHYYFDYAATTPLDERVAKKMTPYFSERFGNAGSIHTFGQEAIAALDHSRAIVAKAVGAQFNEIIFTGSATEANNLALRGTFRALRDLRPARPAGGFAICDRRHPPRIIVSAIEHESVLETARDLEREGAEVVMLPVSREGIVDLDALRSALNERTVLVSVMYANHEVGSVQPISEIAQIIRNFKAQSAKSKEQSAKGKRLAISDLPVRQAGLRLALGHLPLLHTDAVQAFQYLDCNVEMLGVDLMTFSSHKIYGPKGVGALYVRNWKLVNSKEKLKTSSNYQLPITNYLSPLVTGGGQEYGLRSGTENIPAIVGFAEAVRINEAMREKESQRVARLRDACIARIQKAIPRATVNGSREERLPNNINLHIPAWNAQQVLVALDRMGIAVSAGPACAARSGTPSLVLQAMGYSRAHAEESIRITFGRPTTMHDVDVLVQGLVKLVR